VKESAKIVIDFTDNMSSQGNKASPGNLLVRKKIPSPLDNISQNGMFSVEYSNGVITIDRSFGGKRSTRQLKRKRMESDSEDFESNVENSMSHNLERRSKRQRII
jgi:hypothetical protein